MPLPLSGENQNFMILKRPQCLILLLFVFASCKSEIADSNCSNIQNTLTHLSLLSELEWQLSGSAIVLDESVDGIFKTMHMNNLKAANQKSVIYFVFEETDCRICLEQQFQFVKGNSKYSPVILLGIFAISRDYKVFIEKNELGDFYQSTDFLSEHPIPKLDEHQLSYYLEVDQSFKVKSVHFPMKEYPEISRAFLESRFRD